MGNLLRFARGTDDTFRFGIELVGKTVFFVRQEKHPKELIPDVFGYGHTFPARYTAWEADVKGSKSHQRIISYNFSGIKCAVRFECDGYLKYLAHPGERQASGSTMSKVIRDETVTASLEQLSIGETESSQNSLEVQSAGEVVPQGSIFDLKTRSNRKEIDMSQMYPRLWVSQIPNFIVAYHTQGLFKDEDIHVKDVRDEVIKWQEENQASVKRLHVLLNLIIEFAKTANQNKQLEICRNEVDTIEIRERGAADNLRVLPDSLLDTWEGGSTGLGDESPGVSDIDHNITDDWPEPDSDAESEKDYTACSASGCGYCGHCRY